LFHRTLATKLTGYALGRGESIADARLIEQMLADLEQDHRFASLVERLVTSRQFRYRRGFSKPSSEAAPTPPPVPGEQRE
jgi:hypothetical protein